MQGQEKTLEEVLGGQQATPPSWAVVVKGSSDFNKDFRSKGDAFAKKIQLTNSKKVQEEADKTSMGGYAISSGHSCKYAV